MVVSLVSSIHINASLVHSPLYTSLALYNLCNQTNLSQCSVLKQEITLHKVFTMWRALGKTGCHLDSVPRCRLYIIVRSGSGGSLPLILTVISSQGSAT
ncbi:hypothetical protein GDO81_021933 [Engystomops pustulosus]|uniref:Uncharacterized protein n=1 Tax=Engystomops pustulosus TaxID=76066 RepID=A0AAV6ZUN3_ENGPU|nr:hypothetical protein GDO81_021933 [Engystomops pustulosus]